MVHNAVCDVGMLPTGTLFGVSKARLWSVSQATVMLVVGSLW
jgi:hypothetical protein